MACFHSDLIWNSWITTFFVNQSSKIDHLVDKLGFVNMTVNFQTPRYDAELLHLLGTELSSAVYSLIFYTPINHPKITTWAGPNNNNYNKQLTIEQNLRLRDLSTQGDIMQNYK